MEVLFLFGLAFRDGLEVGFGHFDAGTLGNLYGGLGSISTDEGDMHTVGQHHAVARFEAVAILGLFLGLLALWADDEEIEDHDHCGDHDGSFPTVGNSE